MARERGVRRGGNASQAKRGTSLPSSMPLHPAFKLPPRSLNQVMFLVRSHGPRACWDPKMEGKVCRDFKAFPRSSCLRRRGAAQAPLLRAPTLALTTRLAVAARVPSALRAPSSRSRAPRAAQGLGNRIHQEASLVHHKAHPSGSKGRGPKAPQEISFHNLLRRPGVASSPGTKSAVPLHLTFLLRWGGYRKLLEVPEPPPPQPPKCPGL